MEKIAVIYWSGTGNTKIMADAVAAGIKDGGYKPEVFEVTEFKGNIADYSKLALGCPSMGDEVLEECDFEPFFESIEGDLKGKKIALFGSYGWGDGKWMRDWEERAAQDGASVYDEGLIVNGMPDSDGKEQCTALGKGLAGF